MHWEIHPSLTLRFTSVGNFAPLGPWTISGASGAKSPPLGISQSPIHRSSWRFSVYGYNAHHSRIGVLSFLWTCHPTYFDIAREILKDQSIHIVLPENESTVIELYPVWKRKVWTTETMWARVQFKAENKSNSCMFWQMKRALDEMQGQQSNLSPMTASHLSQSNDFSDSEN